MNKGTLLLLTPFLLASAMQARHSLPPASPITAETCPRLCSAATVRTAAEDGQAAHGQIQGIRQINPTTVEVLLQGGRCLTLDFYGPNICRLFRDDKGGIVRDPAASPEAKILVEHPRRTLLKPLEVSDREGYVCVSTGDISVDLDKATGLMHITDLRIRRTVVEETALPLLKEDNATLSLKAHPKEYFYGGGVQNGRFSHRGKRIEIVNTNNWTDGGVASPTPFYWSTQGYGLMWHTFARGHYDFGATQEDQVLLCHETDYMDIFLMVDAAPEALLADFYQLTGQPVLLPKFGFYEGHLNAYNRDYWKEDPKGILFEDGKRYAESQKDNGGIRESLNGESDNYPFSARAVIDRYASHDMPLGWLLPNDGYGAGYGQTETLDGNVQNLKEFGDYARSKGVEIGLWTQSDLHPKEGVEPLLQRDIVKEVRDAGVRVLKTDVAWVGAGYSFGLNGVTDVGRIMPYYGNDARPFIISLDGWAGTQRHAGIWTGDQTGGQWEYIRFHIPTYIGSGLSGQPNICSDMDGIFGRRNVPVNVRDYQWKTFTPMQLNMDGWGANPKYPHALGEPAASINRWYLKMKSELMPYTYSIAHEAVSGKPMIRAMFLEYPNDYTMGTATRYQFLYGPSLLVAPVYQDTRMDKEGRDIRHGIYLPEGRWVDYFTGEVYEGGCVLNSFDVPLWKLPLFVKAGAILPMTGPNNNPSQVDAGCRIYEVYPCGETSFTEYDDDGTTEQYRRNLYATTRITSKVKGTKAIVCVEPTEGSFRDMVRTRTTTFRVNTTCPPGKVTMRYGKKKLKLSAVHSMEELEQGSNVYYYEERPNLNRYATKDSAFARVEVIKNPVLHVKSEPLDITAGALTLEVEGYRYERPARLADTTGPLSAPKAQVSEEDRMPYSLNLSWDKVDHADYYEIETDGIRHTHILDCAFRFDDLDVETEYTYKVRAVNKEGTSDWTQVTCTTKSDPLEFAIRGITAETTCENQGGMGIDKLFDFDEKDTWHSRYGTGDAVPFDILIDLNRICTLDRFEYITRHDGGNGTPRAGKVAYSMDKNRWTEAGTFAWEGAGTKRFDFTGHPTARYIRLSVTKAVGNFGSGVEMYIFKVPGSESLIPGDINRDDKVDENDLTSYMNYTGLRSQDSDFDYIRIGDLNGNGLIDAYDISSVATRMNGGVGGKSDGPLAGTVRLTPSKKTYKAGEEVVLTVKGTGLTAVNALSFCLPYDTDELEYVKVDPVGMKGMHNLTYDRLHTNGQKALYPTFVHLGEKESLEDGTLMTIRFRAKKNLTPECIPTDGILVDRLMNSIAF